MIINPSLSAAAENTGSNRGNPVPGPPEELWLRGFLGSSRAWARLALEWAVGFWAWNWNFFEESAYGILHFQKTEHVLLFPDVLAMPVCNWDLVNKRVAWIIFLMARQSCIVQTNWKERAQAVLIMT